MTKPRAEHARFVIERAFTQSPDRVFRALSERDIKARWFVGPDDWAKDEFVMDFRVGGRERLSGGPPGGTLHTFDCVYHDIVHDERIVYVYDLYIGDYRMSVTLASMLLVPEGTGTKLVLTEDGIFFGGIDDAKQREVGTRVLLDQLRAEVCRQFP
jgi:uncharacterized protein YndB with AHSA1/START domain